MNKELEKAIEVMKNGGIVIFPTDTAFGIGCRMDDEKAIVRLYTIRQRPKTQAASVLVSDISMAKRYVKEIPEDAEEKLIKKFWPGALTIVLQSNNDKVFSLIRGGTDTLGVRMPHHKDCLEIIKAVGVPILGPSANFHGKPAPFSFEDLDPELVQLVDYVLPGVCGRKEVSTVIDCSVKPWKILRQGAVDIQL